MRVLRSRRSKVITAAACGVALGLGAIAGAYWTGGGSGTGTARANATVQGLTVNQTTVSGLSPGSSAPLSGTITNPNGFQVKVGTLTPTVPVATSDPACLPADFHVTGGPIPVNAVIPKNSSTTAWSGLTLVMDDTAANQDACRTATVSVSYTLAPYTEPVLPPLGTYQRNGMVITIYAHTIAYNGGVYTFAPGDTLSFYLFNGTPSGWTPTLATADADGNIYYSGVTTATAGNVQVSVYGGPTHSTLYSLYPTRL